MELKTQHQLPNYTPYYLVILWLLVFGWGDRGVKQNLHDEWTYAPNYRATTQKIKKLT